MKRTASLCFTKDGIFNPTGLTDIYENPDINTVVLFGDGSVEALGRIESFITNPVFNLPQIKRVALGVTPKYELRVIRVDGSISRPNYVYNDDVRTKWICSKVAAPHVQIYLSDITSQSGTQAHLDKVLTETVCYLAHRLWSLLLAAEDRLSFPAVVIDRMTRWTYSLKPNTIDIDLLRNETGLSTLDYNSDTDMLSVEVGGDTFIIKLSVLNDFYGELILPFFNHIYGRRLRISVAITGSTGVLSDPIDMSYGDLGRIIEDMRMYIRERTIDQDHPIESRDLLSFTKKVKIDGETCFWMEAGETLDVTIQRYKSKFLSGDGSDDYSGTPDSDIFSDENRGYPTASS